MEITITMKIEDKELKDLLGLHKEEPKAKRKPCHSPYARVFDETCPGWSKDPEANKWFLLHQQEYANVKLKHQGYLFLNEVYDMLGLPRTRAGQCIGWTYDKHNPVGDNYVDFGLCSEHNRHFINGLDKTVVLDFNVDGDILDHFEEEP